MSLADRIDAARAARPFRPRPELLLCPQIPMPMSGVAPRVVLGKEWWDQTRRAAIRATGGRCAACGVDKYQARFHQWLEGHEVYDVDYLIGRMTYLETVPLCHACHSFVHEGRLLALARSGELSWTDHTIIMRHGRKVLKAAGLSKPKPYSGPCADWADWRMVVGGREYPPLYKSMEEWSAAFEREEPSNERDEEAKAAPRRKRNGPGRKPPGERGRGKGQRPRPD